MTDWALTAATIVGEQENLANGTLTIDGNRIATLAGGRVNRAIDLGDHTVIPGLIDVHIHGRERRDVMDADPASLRIIAASLARHGVTGFLATTVTAGWDRTLAAISTVGDAMSIAMPGARLLGAYSEGLFFSERHKGAHNPAYFLDPSAARIAQMQEAARGHLKVVALAPERPGAREAIDYAVANDIRVVIGHTDASYDETMAALAAGASGGVHVFNGMRGIHHRDPGCAGAVLLGQATVEVIADGVHLHPAILQLIRRLKTPDDILLISDCMCAGGLSDGRYRLGEMEVEVANGVVRTDGGSLAGSTLTLEAAVARMARDGGIPLRDAIHSASLSPARFLGIADRAGSLTPGKQADFAILDADGRNRATIVGGTLAWCDPTWERAAPLISVLGPPVIALSPNKDPA
jgi:N-acetylglucosamine-6-phosphate deacetylase